jgi:hypothetical protein
MPAADPLYTVCDGRLCFDGVDLVELAESRETPLFVFSERRLRANVKALVESFRRVHAPTRSSTRARPVPTCGSSAWCGTQARTSR